ncbi:MAG: hypothetical protein AB2L12_11220 [Smithellaceae bacterium]
MENNILAKQIIDFHKSTFDNAFNSLSILQQQTEKMVQTFLQQATWLPAEGKTAINEWLNIYNKGRVDFKTAADNNYKKVEEYFAVGEFGTKTKTAKTK